VNESVNAPRFSSSPGVIPRLQVRSASKTFGRTQVLQDVDLMVLPGEIHGLVGQNGSGKSTLIKLLTGLHVAEQGTEVSLDGAALDLPISPAGLQRRGLAFVHQDLGLDPEASVIENIRIGRFSVGRFSRRIDWRSEAVSVANTLTTIGAGGINPYAAVGTLNHAQKASVAIARALQGLSVGGGCIIFDESTQSLPRDILHEFYAQVRSLAATGTSVVLVSHRLEEILTLCDTVTVLEDGRVTVRSKSTEGLTEAELARLIMGQSAAENGIPQVFHRTAPWTENKAALVARNLSGGAVQGANLTLHQGEILGVIGGSESGYDQLAYLLAGAMRATSGSIAVGSAEIPAKLASPAGMARTGVGFVPGQRGREGLALDLPALENLSLPRVRSRSKPWSLRSGWQMEEFQSAVSAFAISPADSNLRGSSFSGGNQQKILLAKWLLNRPAVLLLHEPTQAVDVGARADILHALRSEADKGMGVLICSLEAQDLAAVCDRVIIMRDGAVCQELLGDDVNAHTIIENVYTRLVTETENVPA
jgi:ribose transport system ATP-binding protein